MLEEKFITIADTGYSYKQRFVDATHDYLAEMLLEGKLRLHEIPSLLRCEGRVYIAALRVSRNFFNPYIEDLNLMMEDYKNLPKDFNGNYVSQNDLRRDILNVLDSNVRLGTMFKGARAYEEFVATVYEPFLQEAHSNE